MYTATFARLFYRTALDRELVQHSLSLSGGTSHPLCVFVCLLDGRSLLIRSSLPHSMCLPRWAWCVLRNTVSSLTCSHSDTCCPCRDHLPLPWHFSQLLEGNLSINRFCFFWWCRIKYTESVVAEVKFKCDPLNIDVRHLLRHLLDSQWQSLVLAEWQHTLESCNFFPFIDEWLWQLADKLKPKWSLLHTWLRLRWMSSFMLVFMKKFQVVDVNRLTVFYFSLFDQLPLPITIIRHIPDCHDHYCHPSFTPFPAVYCLISPKCYLFCSLCTVWRQWPLSNMCLINDNLNSNCSSGSERAAHLYY